MIIDEELPLGLIANTSAVLALTIGDKIKGIIGDDIFFVDFCDVAQQSNNYDE